jgi:Cd2+/Zn2+-exporting ATPase
VTHTPLPQTTAVSVPPVTNTPARPSFTLSEPDRLAPILVAITALAIVTSLIAERLEAPPSFVLAVNVISYVAGGWFGLQAGVRSLLQREINVDLLMVLAALGASIVDQWHEGAILLFLFSLSNVLQTYAMDRSRNAIKALLKLRPNQATVRRNGSLAVVPIEQLVIGDTVVIRPGERLPIDGKVSDGSSAVDQAPITGESMPVLKVVGDDVFAGTVNQHGSLDVRVTRPASDTTLSRIIKMVEDAQGQRAQMQRFLDEFEQKYAMLVIFGIALFIVIPPLLPGGPSFSDNFYRAMVLMTVLSPCALVISTPASVLSAIANAARRGILFKGGAYLEQMALIKAVAFDKTGTITTGKPAVTDLIAHGNTTPARLLAIAATVESRSEHPIAQAVMRHAQQQQVAWQEPDAFESIPGQGVWAQIAGRTVLAGSERLMATGGVSIPEEVLAQRAALEQAGKTVLIAHDSGEGCLGLIAVADELRPNAAAIIRAIRKAGIDKVVMLTGDNERVAQAIAQKIGADEVRANLLPEHKVDAVKELQQKYGTVAMVGDGVNDAPALATATIGIAMGAAGTDVALETADVVLMADDLSNIAYAMELSRRARRIVWQNIGFSLAVMAVLALGVFAVELALPLGVVGHEGSTLIVVSNGLRLLAFRGPSALR